MTSTGQGRQGHTMSTSCLFYRATYRFGHPRWDSAQPRPELQELVDGHSPGRALDLGCGTGTNALYLANEGWDVVGVDFAPEAIDEARQRAHAGASSASFVVADVTRLKEAGVSGPFDVIVDIGCYHGIPAGRRRAYVAEAAAVARPGCDFYLAGVADPPGSWRLLGARGVTGTELERRFGGHFNLVEERAVGVMGRRSDFVLYHLVRK